MKIDGETVAMKSMESLLPLGLILWYPMDNGRILIQGEHSEEFAKALSDNGLICDIEPEEGVVYDYILGIRYLEIVDNPAEQLETWKNILAAAGHIFLAMENRLGLQFFCGDRDPYTGRVFDSVEGYRNYLIEDRALFKGHLMGKAEVEELLDGAGLLNRKFYSILPGLTMPQQIFAEGIYPNEQLAIRYSPIYHSPQTVFLNQGILFDSLIRNGMFHQMANAYLIDITIDGSLYDAASITTSLDRGKEKATATIIRDCGVVEKKPLFQEGNTTTKALLDNAKYLSDRGVSVIPMSETADGVSMPVVQGEIGTDYFRRLFYENYQLFLSELDRYISLVKKSSEQISEKKRAEILVENGEYEELGPIYEKLFIDMVPLNCFVVDGEFVFFDQEFAFDYMPISITLARVFDIIYMGDRSMEQLHPVAELYARYGLQGKVNLLRKKGGQFINSLRNRDSLEGFRKQYWADSAIVNNNRMRTNYSEQELNRLYEFPMKNSENKEIYIFGTGAWAKKFLGKFQGYCNLAAALDNNESKQGQDFYGLEIVAPSVLRDKDPETYKVVICIKHLSIIVNQLEQMGVKYYSAFDPDVEWKELKEFYKIKQDEIRKRQEEEPIVSADNGDGIGHYHRGYVAGVFDLFHVGHLNILRRAKEHCDHLIVGVVSDEQASQGKAHSPYIKEQERLEIVRACRYVDEAFIIPILASDTRSAYLKHQFDAQFSGSDYADNPSWLAEQAWLRERGSDLVFFPYTETVSSTKLKQQMKNQELT